MVKNGILKLQLVMTLMFCLLACSEQKTAESNPYFERCNQWDDDSLQVLKGILNINSKGEFIFNNLESRDTWERKTHLVPCSDNLEEYITRSYDGYLYLKNFDEQFWVFVEGQYITPDTLDDLPMFLFDFVALIDEEEAETGVNQAMRELMKEEEDNDEK